MGKVEGKVQQARPLHSSAASAAGGATPATSVSADDALKQQQQQRMRQGEELKNEGNTLMQAKSYEAAIAA